MTRRVVVVGGGVVGTAVAGALVGHADVEVTVLDRSPGAARGSTVLAPGFVGLYNDAAVLTDLARASAAVYDQAEAGFRRAGGLELATSQDGAREVERRASAAAATGLPVTVGTVEALPPAVADVVDTSRMVFAAHYPWDGVAVPAVLLDALRSTAQARGARFVAADVVAVEGRGGGHAVHTGDGEQLDADDIVLAGGVWGPSLAALVGLVLPLFPVSHPYVYASPDPTLVEGPFVRWPEHHVYARVHADRLGIGTYDHRPRPVAQDGLADGACLAWTSELDAAVSTAQQLLRPERRFAPDEKVHGVFAMTPDNLPLLGAHPTAPGIWIAQALWITHAAGAAAALAAAMTDSGHVPAELRVDRFDSVPRAELEQAALRLYRDIYANEVSADTPS